jgi:hypothetical protein
MTAPFKHVYLLPYATQRGDEVTQSVAFNIQPTRLPGNYLSLKCAACGENFPDLVHYKEVDNFPPKVIDWIQKHAETHRQEPRFETRATALTKEEL